MKFTVEVDDFYLEQEELESGLQTFVRNEVLKQVSKNIEKKVEDHLLRKISEEVEKNMYKQMNVFISDFITKGEVKSMRDSSKWVSVEEYIKEKFTYSSGWSSPDEFIKKLAEKFSSEMKARYDLLFASQLVAKMNDTGLLKKDVAKILLSQS